MTQHITISSIELAKIADNIRIIREELMPVLKLMNQFLCQVTEKTNKPTDSIDELRKAAKTIKGAMKDLVAMVDNNDILSDDRKDQ